MPNFPNTKNDIVILAGKVERVPARIQWDFVPRPTLFIHR